jgi:hypothetical protein
MKLSAMKVGQQAQIKAQDESTFTVTWRIDLEGRLMRIPAKNEAAAKAKALEFLKATDDPLFDAMDELAGKRNLDVASDWDYQVISVKKS